MDRSRLAAGYARMKKGTVLNKYLQQSPGEAAKLDAYVDAIKNGQNPTEPSIASDFGAGLAEVIAAGLVADAPPVTPPPVTPTESPDNTVVQGTNGSIVDASGNKWTINATGQVAVNGTADASTSSVSTLAYESKKIWQKNSSNLWWSKSKPTDAWSPTGGTSTSPIPGDTPPPTPTPSPVTNYGGGLTGPRWGFCSHLTRSAYGGSLDQQISKIVSSKAAVIRSDISAGTVCPSTPGTYTWGTFDTLLGGLSQAGVKIIMMVGYSAGWMNGGKGDKKGPTVGNYGHWGDAVAAMAQRAHDKFPGVVVGVELWNEPNNSTFWTTPETGATGANSAPSFCDFIIGSGVYAKCKAVAPEIRVIFGGTDANGLSWYKKALESRPAIVQHFDDASFHPYVWNTNMTGAQMVGAQGWGIRSVWNEGPGGNDSQGNPRGTQCLRDLLNSHGFKGLIHGTEWGAPTNTPDGKQVPRGTSEQNQADLFRLGWPQWFTNNPQAGHLFWYVLADNGHGTRMSWDPASAGAAEDHFGAWRSDDSEKPVVQQMRNGARP